MIYFFKFLYNTFLLPPGFFIMLLLLLAAYFFWRKKKLSWIMLAMALLLYLCSNSFASDAFIRTLESRYSPPADVSGDVIVMLGGGARQDTPNVNGTGHLSGYAANRLLTCAQLYYKLEVPIIISGGQVYKTSGSEGEIARAILVGLGIPKDKVIVEGKSLNTTQNAQYTKEILEEYKFRQPILVTSAFHMERSVRQFKKVGLEVIPYPTDYQVNVQPGIQGADFWPTVGALHNVSLTLKEYIGILMSRWT